MFIIFLPILRSSILSSFTLHIWSGENFKSQLFRSSLESFCHRCLMKTSMWMKWKNCCFVRGQTYPKWCRDLWTMNIVIEREGEMIICYRVKSWLVIDRCFKCSLLTRPHLHHYVLTRFFNSSVPWNGWLWNRWWEIIGERADAMCDYFIYLSSLFRPPQISLKTW